VFGCWLWRSGRHRRGCWWCNTAAALVWVVLEELTLGSAIGRGEIAEGLAGLEEEHVVLARAHVAAAFERLTGSVSFSVQHTRLLADLVESETHAGLPDVIDGGVSGAVAVEHHATRVELERNADVALSEVGLVTAGDWCDAVSWTRRSGGGRCGRGGLGGGGWKSFAVTASFTVVDKLHSLVSTVVFTDVTCGITSHLWFAVWHRLTLALVTGAFLDLGSDWILGSVQHTSVTLLWKSYADVRVEFFRGSGWTGTS